MGPLLGPSRPLNEAEVMTYDRTARSVIVRVATLSIHGHQASDHTQCQPGGHLWGNDQDGAGRVPHAE